MANEGIRCQNPERRFLVEEAFDLVQSELEYLGYRAEVRKYGVHLCTSHCYLYDHDGHYVAEGLGKGAGMQSRASAIFEALEHHFGSAKYHVSAQIKARHVWSKISQLPQVDTLMRDKAMELLLRHHPETEVPCRVFQSFDNHQTLLHPLVLTIPDYPHYRLPGDTFDYTRILRYSSGNGTAIGADFTEAAIHAINERVERDAESLFLIRTFLLRPPELVRLVDPDSLPCELRKLWDQINELATDRLLIIDTTTELGIPAFCAFFTQQKRMRQPGGCGCSLCKEYALERALLEALQEFHIYQEFAEECDDADAALFNALRGLLRYQDCARGDVASLIKEGFCETVDFDELIAPQAPANVDAYLDRLLGRLADSDFQAFYSVSYKSPRGLTCLNVLIPGMESFHLVKFGNAVLPGRRGCALLHQRDAFPSAERALPLSSDDASGYAS